MRILVGLTLFVGACSSSATTPAKPVAKSCVPADAPTIVAAATRCGTLYVEEADCRPNQVEGSDRHINLIYEFRGNRFKSHFGIDTPKKIFGGKTHRIDAKGEVIIDEAMPVTSCVPSYVVTTLEVGVFEVREEHPMFNSPPGVSHWHVDRARCESERLARMKKPSQDVVAGLGGCS